jgi:carbon monoxide dehydrogenase subunit G
MQIDNAFTVAAPAGSLWVYLLDVEKVAPCMPGAELTEVVDDHTWKGKVEMKFGPVAMSFAGTVVVDSRDDDSHRISLTAKGMETKGKGAANATVTSWLEPGPQEGSTTVKMSADITLTGAAAQLSRGLLPEISKQLTQRFADCLETAMTAEQTIEPSGIDTATHLEGKRPAPTPVGGFALGLSALWAIIGRFFTRLLRRGARP